METSHEMTKRPRRNRVTGCNRDMFSYPGLTWITFRLSQGTSTFCYFTWVIYHRSHRPWKSFQDFHTPAADQLLVNKTK
jgi:hypothetical protein